MTTQQYIINTINELSIGQTEIVSRMIRFKEYPLIQTHNRAYINIDLLNDCTISEIYDFMVSCVT